MASQNFPIEAHTYIPIHSSGKKQLDLYGWENPIFGGHNSDISNLVFFNSEMQPINLQRVIVAIATVDLLAEKGPTIIMLQEIQF